jgi:hypothetical protein
MRLRSTGRSNRQCDNTPLHACPASGANANSAANPNAVIHPGFEPAPAGMVWTFAANADGERPPVHRL